jgi:hypothetical protein
MKLLGRYFYSIVFLIVALFLLVLIGFSFSNISAIANFPLPINLFYALIWRCGMYFLLWWIWKPLITKRIGDNTVFDIGFVVKKSRDKLLVALVLFELFIVQNVFWATIVTIEGLLYGR